MKGGCKYYPNTGVKIDPRSISSDRLPESLKVFSGFLFKGYRFLKRRGYLTIEDIERTKVIIEYLEPLSETQDKIKSSHWIRSEKYLIEFFRTTKTNYKIYALRIVFEEDSQDVNDLFRNEV